APPANRKRKGPTCKTAKNGHTKFGGKVYCQIGEGPRAKTSLEWRRQQRQAATVDVASIKGMPHRVTLCRWRKQVKQDKRILEEEKGKPQSQPGDPCAICGRPRTLDAGHAFYKGQFYCELEWGPEAPTAKVWLAGQRTPQDAGKVPRTTQWNLKKRMGRQAVRQAQEGNSPGSSSPGPSRRKHTSRKLCFSSSSSSPASPSSQAPQAAHLPAVPPAGTKRLWAQSFGWDKLLCPVHRK
ncbi:hypothetical protein FQN60_018617, partial [Etheostoma spectabile]